MHALAQSHPPDTWEAPAGTASSPVAPVSVVIPCFRCADTIADAVASVHAQTLRPAEVLLVDDGSGDDTVAALQRLVPLYPDGWLKVVELGHNRGPSAARNAGWERASQRWLAFLDADDSWFPRKIEVQMRTLRRDPSIALLGHRMNVQPRGACPPDGLEAAAVTEISRSRLLLRNPFQTPAVMLRRDLPFRFDESFSRGEDFLLWAQVCLSGHRCARIEQVLASVHKPAFGHSGLSGDLAAMHRAGKQIRRKLRRDGLLTWREHEQARVLGLVRRTRRNLIMFWRRHAAQPGAGP